MALYNRPIGGRNSVGGGRISVGAGSVVNIDTILDLYYGSMATDSEEEEEVVERRKLSWDDLENKTYEVVEDISDTQDFLDKYKLHVCDICPAINRDNRFDPDLCLGCQSCLECAEFEDGECDGCSYSYHRENKSFPQYMREIDEKYYEENLSWVDEDQYQVDEVESRISRCVRLSEDIREGNVTIDNNPILNRVQPIIKLDL